ncbi:hypothetical protein ERS043914_00327, partial [Streptococcus pneumoniae]
MVKIGLFCAAGFSTGMLVNNRLVRNLVHFIIDDGTN